MSSNITIIGGGLAGCEAAWQIAKRGIKVTLFEMRPKKTTNAHNTDLLCELVCSNSFRSNSIENAPGLLKEELRIMDSLIMKVADATTVPAGSALSVDREKFSSSVTDIIEREDNITVIREEVSSIPEGQVTIVASGPLTSDSLARYIQKNISEEYLYFYDAISPIIAGDSINYDKAFFASRYDKGGKDYLNCPMTNSEYDIFYDNLVNGKKVSLKEFEEIPCFESCMPVEDMAKRGKETLTFGPMKPVGLINPATNNVSFAVVQLRKENREATMFNIVGFQTKLTYGEQKRIFRMIPGLEDAEFLRFGSIHRNTFINSPKLLEPGLQLKTNKSLFFAGQITGAEGYIESVASGLVAGINAARSIEGKDNVLFPETSSLGALTKYLTVPNKSFQPMHINFGLFPPLEKRVRSKKDKKRKVAERALRNLKRQFTLDS